MQDQIVEFLKSKHNPEAILLAGSRAKGIETENSDWDLFILGSQSDEDGFVEFQGQLLDTTLKDWPNQENALNIPSGPLWPVKILFDQSNGKLLDVLDRTERSFNQGPLELYEAKVLERLDKLEGWQRKIYKYRDKPMVSFFYVSILYEFAIRLWFELQNIWSRSPNEAVEYIKEKDQQFYFLLESVTDFKDEQVVHSVGEIVSLLKSISTNKN